MRNITEGQNQKLNTRLKEEMHHFQHILWELEVTISPETTFYVENKKDLLHSLQRFTERLIDNEKLEGLK